MAAKANSFNNGAEGDALTPASSAGSGDAFTLGGTTTGSPTAVYAAVAAARGARGGKYQSTASTDLLSHQFSDTAAAQSASLIALKITDDNLPVSAAYCLARTRSTGNSSKLVLSTTGVLSLQHGGGTGIKNFNGNARMPNGIYFISWRVTTGTTTSNGAIEVVIYNSDGSTFDSYSNTATNTSTVNQQYLQWGKPESSGGYCPNGILLDEPRFVTGSSVGMYPAPAADPVNTPPTANAGADISVESGAAVVLAGADSDADGTVVARSWKLGSTEVSTTASLAFIAPVVATDTVRTYTYTVTDNAGASTSDTVVVTIRKALIIGGDGTAYVVRTTGP